MHPVHSALNQISFLVATCLVLSNANAYVIGNKLSKVAGNGQSNIAYSQDNKGSYQFAYEVTDKGSASLQLGDVSSEPDRLSSFA